MTTDKSPSPGATRAAEAVRGMCASAYRDGSPANVTTKYLAGLIESLAVAPAVEEERKMAAANERLLLDSCARKDAKLKAEKARADRLAEALKITHGALLGLRDAFRIEGRSEYPTLNMAIDAAQAALEGTDGPDL